MRKLTQFSKYFFFALAMAVVTIGCIPKSGGDGGSTTTTVQQVVVAQSCDEADFGTAGCPCDAGSKCDKPELSCVNTVCECVLVAVT